MRNNSRSGSLRRRGHSESGQCAFTRCAAAIQGLVRKGDLQRRGVARLHQYGPTTRNTAWPVLSDSEPRSLIVGCLSNVCETAAQAQTIMAQTIAVLIVTLAVATTAAVADQTFPWGAQFAANVTQCESVTITNDGFHNLYQLDSGSNWAACTFGASDVLLASTSFTSYTFPRSTFVQDGAVVYVACEISSHCAGGTKGQVTVGSTVYPGYEVVGGACQVAGVTSAPTTAAPTTAAPTTAAPTTAAPSAATRFVPLAFLTCLATAVASILSANP